MKAYRNEAISYCKELFKSKHFWEIQWVNLMYVVKYTMKYQLIIFASSLSMSYLYVELTNEYNGLFTKMQSETIISAFVTQFILVCYLLLIVSLVRLFLPSIDRFARAKQWNSFFRRMLFVLLVASSKYLRAEVIFQNVSIEAIPAELLVSGLSVFASYLSMIFCIRHFWKMLDKQMLLSDITSKECLAIDVCNEKVYFVNGWNEFVQVLEAGITYKNNQTGDFFCRIASSYAKNRDTELEKKVVVSLKYSLITGKFNRLDAGKIKYYEGNIHSIYVG